MEQGNRTLKLPWGEDDREMALGVLIALNDGFDCVEIESEGRTLIRWVCLERDENGVMTKLGSEHIG
jgi:hypothetical protein